MWQIEQAGLPHLHTFHVNTCIVNQPFRRVHDGRTRFWQLKAARISERKLGGLPAWRRRTKSLQVQVRPIDCKTHETLYIRDFKRLCLFWCESHGLNFQLYFAYNQNTFSSIPDQNFSANVSHHAHASKKLLSLNYICMHKNYLSDGDLCWINHPNSIVHYGLVFEQSPQKQ